MTERDLSGTATPAVSAPALPQGRVSFLYTDIEGSTRLWQEQPERMPGALARHDTLIREAVRAAGGVIFRSMGDALCAAFPDAPAACAAACAAQPALAAESWPEGCAIRVRMAVHTGEAEPKAGDYVGHTLNRVARLLAAGHGGQILVSAETRERAGETLPLECQLLDLGEHRLKDLTALERVYQLTVPGLPQSFPPLVTAGGQATNLPTQPTPFIGRGRELDAVTRLLADPTLRLLTLTGPGGTGKTRLALAAAATRLPYMRDGVFAVFLASLADPDLVPSAIAEALGVKEQSGKALTESLNEFLADKRLLLLLDNVEHLLGGAALVARLLTRCATLQVLVTSRIPLHVSHEREYAVPPLAFPDPDRLPPLETLPHYDAPLFFVDRARAVRADFGLTDENARAVVEICRKLDGLPLAIELAAARIKLFPPQALLQRLSGRLALLTGGGTDRPNRQQTLRNTIDWSYSLLSRDGRRLLARLSAFAGGCTLEAAEAVCNQEGELDVVEGIASLLDKSMLRQEGEAEPRIGMLETIREYAAEKLEERGEETAIRLTHARYVLALGEEAAPELQGPKQREWFERLATEIDNLRAGMRTFLEEGQTEEALRLASALLALWDGRGHWSEGRRWLEEGLAQGGDAIAAGVQALALNALSALAYRQGDFQRAETAAEQALALYRQVGDRWGSTRALLILGNIAMDRGQYQRARVFYEETAQVFRELKDLSNMAKALANLGVVAEREGDPVRARERAEEALAISREVGDTRSIVTVLLNLGHLARDAGSLTGAEARLEEARMLAGELGETRLLAYTLSNLSEVRRLQGQETPAHELARKSMELARELGERFLALWLLGSMARLALAGGQADRAARLSGAEQTLRERLGLPLPPVNQAERAAVRNEARAIVGEEAFATAWEQGSGMSLEEAITYAVEGT